MVSIERSPQPDSPSISRTLAGNEMRLLDQPDQIWQIDSGAVGIFAVAWTDGGPSGMRHYLFTASAGESLLGCAPEAYGLVAIAFEPTKLLPVSLSSSIGSDFSGSSFSGSSFSGSNSSAGLAAWFNHFSQIEGFPVAPAAVAATTSQHVSLTDGDYYSHEQQTDQQIAWAEIKSGQAQWLSLPQVKLTPQTGLFPLAEGTWLQASSVVELQIHLLDSGKGAIDSKAIPPNISAGIAQFHRYALEIIEMIIIERTQRDFQQFQQQQALNQQSTQKALYGLASLIKTEEEGYLTAKTPLLVAAGAVGHVLGVSISPPSNAENLQQIKEPLEAIARASQLRLRQILLRGAWWTQDSGPMVAYTRREHQPVALLPVKDRQYEMLDPVSLGRSPVTEAIANSLEPKAFVFYRPLPDGTLNAWTLLKFAFHGRQRDLWMILLTGVGVSLLGMAIPQATAVLIDNAIPYGSRGILLQIGLALLAVAFGRACFQFAQAIAAMRIESSSDLTLQAAVWDRLLKLHPSFFREYATGDLQSRVSSINAIRRKLSGTALDAILSGAFALLNLILLFYYSAKLAVLALFVALLVASVTSISGVILLKKQRPLLALDGELYGLMVQLINGVSKLRIAGAEPRAFAQWAQKYRQQLQLDLSTQKLEDGVNVFNTAMPTLTAIGLFGLATTLVDTTSMAGLSSGTFLAFSAAFAIFISGATSLSLTLIEVLEVIPLWQRSQPILAAQPEVNLQKSD
ncbi:MAG: ABC transporter transmembrane domain-containing protein, partial [Phormidesmis sp.]